VLGGGQGRHEGGSEAEGFRCASLVEYIVSFSFVGEDCIRGGGANRDPPLKIVEKSYSQQKLLRPRQEREATDDADGTDGKTLLTRDGLDLSLSGIAGGELPGGYGRQLF
jgi:hypothetical protein